ncbi:MAG: hypothetical protein MJZ81_11840 [Bacteroidales bacterium]|nr:hypothetical protein [Bacteroidales bacterium]
MRAEPEVNDGCLVESVRCLVQFTTECLDGISESCGFGRKVKTVLTMIAVYALTASVLVLVLPVVLFEHAWLLAIRAIPHVTAFLWKLVFWLVVVLIFLIILAIVTRGRIIFFIRL